MLTASEIFEEYVKCINDPAYAIEGYLKTFDKTQEGFVPFKLFVRQKQIIKSYEKERYNLVTKPRQAGISTVTQAYLSVKLGFADPNNPETIIVIANKLNLAKKFLKGIKDYVIQLPRWVWGNEYYGSKEKEQVNIFVKDSQIEIELPNGSKVIAVATSVDALRGYTPTYLVFDEAAFIDKGSDLYAAAVTSLGCLTKDSLILTENGLVELDELVKEKDKIGFTDLDTPHKVCNMNGKLVDATQTFVSEYGETFKIKTKLGVELEGSWKHPILVKRDGIDVWVRMNELKVGDSPIIQYNQNYFGDSDYLIKDSDYLYPSNELLKAKKEILTLYIDKLFLGRDYFISENKNSLKRVQSLLFNMGIISVIDNNMLVKLKFNHDFNNIFIDEIVEITKSEDYTYDLHVPITNSFISNGIISHNTGGKCTLISCVTKDSFVFTDEGIKQINQFISDENISGGYNVPHYNILGLDKYRQSNIFFNNGFHDTIKIKSSSAELEGTFTHKVWAYSFKHDKYDWYEMSDLSIGDYINIQYGFNLWGSDNSLNCEYKTKNKLNEITNDLAYLLGLHISDNKLAQNTFYNISNEYFDKILSSIGFDLNNKKQDKIIPNKLLGLSRDNMVSLVQGLMDGNAVVDVRLNKITFNSESELLTKQLRMILLNLGILTELKIKDKYQLIISNYNVKLYYDLIGFRFSSKESKKYISNSVSEVVEFIPDGKKIIRDIISEYSLTNRLRNTGLKVSDVKLNKINKSDDLNKPTFIKFINYFTNTLRLNISSYGIDKILLNNSKWEKIKSIDYSKNETYDFSLPNNDNDFWCHSVVYNGILGHQTPNGYDDLYYKTYEQAIRKENTYNIIELKWYEDPRYNKDLRWIKGEEILLETEFTLESFKKKTSEGYKPTSSWYEDMCKNMNQDKKKIAQELDVSFLGSGGNVIDDEYIVFHERNNVTEPKFVDKTYYDGNSGLVWIWSEPIEGHEYICASDVSRGDGSDYSAMQIIDFTTMEQVVEYQGKIPPDLFAELLDLYGRKYNAFLIVDNIGVGHTTTSKLEELKYPDLYYEEKSKGNKVVGFNINGVRLQLISHLEEMIRTNQIKIRSLRLIHEMKTFIYKNGRPDHIEGYHDDCLKKGTLIKTIEGYKPIEDIRVGDLVLTHLGRYKEVEAFLEKPFNGEWYDLKFQGMLNLGLSYNHPLYSAPNTYKNKDNPDYKKRDWVFPSEWVVNKQNNKKDRRQVSIKENLPDNNNTILKYDDFRVKENNENNNNITELTLDTNFAKFLGLFLADGYAPKIDKEYQGNKYYTMSLTFNVEDEELCNEMIAYLKSININSHKTKVVGNGFVLKFTSKFLSGILSHCYDKNREKILPYYAHNLGKDLSYVLDYWIKGDGWVDNKHGYDFIAASTSKQLALSMMDIAWSVGRYATISLHPRKRYGVKNKDQYWVNIRNTYKSQDRLRLISDFEYGNKSVTINKTIYEGTVYNLQVKDDESFIADGIVVHNCIMSLGMALWVLQSSFKSLKKSNEQTKAILSSWTAGGAENSMSSTIEMYDPNKNKKVTKINPSHTAYRNVQDPNGDYLWLFSGLK